MRPAPPRDFLSRVLRSTSEFLRLQGARLRGPRLLLRPLPADYEKEVGEMRALTLPKATQQSWKVESAHAHRHSRLFLTFLRQQSFRQKSPIQDLPRPMQITPDLAQSDNCAWRQMCARQQGSPRPALGRCRWLPSLHPPVHLLQSLEYSTQARRPRYFPRSPHHDALNRTRKHSRFQVPVRPVQKERAGQQTRERPSPQSLHSLQPMSRGSHPTEK